MLDLDGTLVDTLGDFDAALAQMLAQLGRQPVARAKIAQLVGKGSDHLVQSVLALEGPANAALFQQAMALYQHAYLRINGITTASTPA